MGGNYANAFEYTFSYTDLPDGLTAEKSYQTAYGLSYGSYQVEKDLTLSGAIAAPGTYEITLTLQVPAGGVTGGAAETTRLGYDTAYEDALRQGEQGRISALGSLDQAIADTRLNGDIESANAAAAAAKEQADAYADTLKYLINRQDKLDAQQEAYAREDAQRAAAYAAQLAKEQREAEEAAERAAKPTLTVAQVNAAIKAGVLTDAVLAAYEYYYGEAYKQ